MPRDKDIQPKVTDLQALKTKPRDSNAKTRDQGTTTHHPSSYVSSDGHIRPLAKNCLPPGASVKAYEGDVSDADGSTTDGKKARRDKARNRLHEACAQKDKLSGRMNKLSDQKKTNGQKHEDDEEEDDNNIMKNLFICEDNAVSVPGAYALNPPRVVYPSADYRIPLSLRRPKKNAVATTLDHPTRPSVNDPFRPDFVTEIIKEVLIYALQGKTYEEITSPFDKCLELSIQIKEEVKYVLSPRFKIMANVTIGKNVGTAVKIGCRCLWDEKYDNMAKYVFMNDSIFALGVVFGVCVY